MKMPDFKSFSKYELPIIAKDSHRIGELKEILGSLEEDSFAYFDLEEYIDNLTSITSVFLHNISNNLMLKGFTEDIATETTKEIIDKMIILSPPTSDYNCHGWGLGTVANIPSFSTKASFLDDALAYKEQQNLLLHTDTTMTTFFNTTENSLIETFHANQQEGNIEVY